MKRILCCFFLFFSGLTLFSQNNWLRKAGGLSQDEALDIVQDDQGMNYITGYVSSTASFADIQTLSSGASDVLVAKVSSQGAPVWMKSFGGSLPDRGTGIAVDGAGNIYVTGVFTGQATFGSTTLTVNGSGLDVFVLKLDGSGNVIWAVKGGSSFDDYVYDIATDPSGNAIITGQFKGTATFGSSSFTSQTDPDTGQITYDTFIAKLDGNGNWLWTKHGTNPKDSRGLAVGTDADGNVYATGQFSDDMTFDNTYANNVLNAGYLMKLSPTGAEQWWVKFSASQTMCYDMKVTDQGTVFLTGDYMGQMAVIGATTTIIPYTHTYNIFVMKFGTDGSLLFSSKDGSDNPVSARGVALGSQGEIYVAGIFRCSFTEYADETDNGIFYSVGYNDVFVSAYNPEGQRIWKKQYGGQNDDWCAGVVPGLAVNEPIIAGSFSKNFNVPSTYDFTSFPENNVAAECSLTGNDYYCDSQGDYYLFKSVVNNGNRDIFVASPVDINRQHYDYFKRYGDLCVRPYLAPCFNCGETSVDCAQTGISCADTIHACVSTSISPKTGLNCPIKIAPVYDYLWSTGSTEVYIQVNQTGTYQVTITRADMCESWDLSIPVEIHPLPPAPLLSDDIVLNTLAGPEQVQSYTACQDTVSIYFTNLCPACTTYLSAPNAIFSNDTMLTTASTGIYEMGVVDQWGCGNVNQMSVQIQQPAALPDVIPLIEIQFNNQINPDTITLCQGGSFVVRIIDENGSTQFQNFDAVYWETYIDGVLMSSIQGNSNLSVTPSQSGMYLFKGTLTLQWNNLCGSGSVSFETVERQVYVNYLPAPPITVNVIGDVPFCPGDTLLLTATGAQTYTWSGPGILSNPTNDTAIVNHQGNYNVSGTTVYPNGCVKSDSENYNVYPYPYPEVTMSPSHGVVCPGDSLLLTCEPGLDYLWIGPSGELLGNTQSIYVQTPGYYFCTQTNMQGCTMESNFVEAKEYSSPFLIALPGTDLCINGTVTLQIETNDASTLTWNIPEFGNASQVQVSSPGTYICSVIFCGLSTDLSIDITQSDTPSFITLSDTLICPGQSSMLSGNPGMSVYSWSNGAFGQSIDVFQPGQYILTTTDEFGCLGISQPVEVFGYDIAAPSTQGETVCPGEPAVLWAFSDNSVFWSDSPTGFPVLGMGNSLEISSVTQNQTYYAFAMDSICSSAPSAALAAINLSSIAPIITSDTLYCLGDLMMLQANDLTGIQYQWIGPANSFSPGSVFQIPNAGFSQSGWYYLSIINQECPTPTDSLFIEVLAPQESSFESLSPLEVCAGESIHLMATSEGTSYEWQMANGATLEGEELFIEQSSENDSGTYTLWTLGNYCPSTPDSVTVIVHPLPLLVSDSLQAGCEGNLMLLAPTQEFVSYLWSTGTTEGSIVLEEPGWYSLTVWNEYGCENSDSVFVSDIDCLQGMMNIFTPNGDGINDYFDFNLLRITIDEVSIFNRWGTVMCSLGPDNLKWDGKDNSGNDLPPNIYYFSIQSPEPRIHADKLNGYLYLNRERVK